MKKFITLFLLMCSCISGMAQKVVIDEYTKDGNRILITDEKRLCQVQQFVVWAGLAAIVSENTTTYQIKFKYTSAYKLSVNDDASLLLKTFDDKIFNLHTYVSPYSYFSGKSETEFNRYGNIEKLTKFYTISSSDFNYVIDKGITKIRIQMDCKGESIHDKDFKEDKLAKILQNAYKSINDKIASSPTRKSITDGF